MDFRKKPIVIQAWKVDELLSNARSNWKQLPQVVIDEYEKGNVIFANTEIFIQTLEGKMQAQRGDWLICGVKGELYPCKPDIFEATYDAA